MKKLLIGAIFMVQASASVFAAEVKSVEKSGDSWWVTCTSGKQVKAYLAESGKYRNSGFSHRSESSLEEFARVWCKYDG